MRGDLLSFCGCNRLHVGDRLVGVVGRAVGEEVVDEHANNWEEEDNKSPKDFVGHGAVALEDLNCRTHVSECLVVATPSQDRHEVMEGRDILHAMMSRTKTIKPIIPPPVPACHGFAD
jgi:hypothetical protein